MAVILITNDDGVNALGIRRLAESMLDHSNKLVVVAPTVQRSGESKSLTFSRPLRVTKVNLFPFPAFSVDGTPADSVIIGQHLCQKEYGQRPDLIVSGINAGDNSSLHALLTSGTCAAAFEGAILQIPSIAFSLEVKSSELFDQNQSADYLIQAKRASEIVGVVLKHGMPDGIKFLNVNFPSDCTMETPVEVVHLAPEKYRNDVIETTDPRGVEMFWIWGDLVDSIPEGTDSYALMTNRSISITPISLGFGRWAVPKFKIFFDSHYKNKET